ncbi:MAG: diacylglycerol kinase family protein [bacterium]|nr:diacylglycerol kinase family protein [bacterium]
MIYLLYNAKSKNGCNPELQKKLEEKYGIEEKKDVIELDYKEFIKTLKKTDKVILTGGDGTLHHFANYVDGIDLPCNFYFYSSGTGNDFLNDMKDKVEDDLILLNDVVKNLPTVIINDKKYKFIDGVGFGIDGYCCEVGDEKQAKSTKPVNYASIAIKGLLFHYKRPNAKVTVDGVTKEYKKVWLAPTMKGKYYGGGMIIAPDQDRFNSERLVTNVVMHKAGKLHTLMVFSKIFKGEHIKHKKMVDVRVGKHVIVEFSRPTALQIDGETVKGVLKYEVVID